MHSFAGWNFLRSVIQSPWPKTVAVALFICLVLSDLYGSLKKFADMSMGNCFFPKRGDEIVIVCMMAKGHCKKLIIVLWDPSDSASDDHNATYVLELL